MPESYQVFRSGKEIILTGKEFEILMLLADIAEGKGLCLCHVGTGREVDSYGETFLSG